MASLLNACIINTNRSENNDIITTWDGPKKLGTDSKRTSSAYLSNPYQALDYDKSRTLAQLSSAVANLVYTMNTM